MLLFNMKGEDILELLKDSAYFNVAENAPMPVLWSMPDGVFFHVNPSAIKLFEITLEEFKNTNFADISHSANQDIFVSLFDLMRKEKVTRHQTILYSKNGKALDFEVVGNYINIQGLEFANIYLFDITERLRKDRELQDKTVELETINEQLENLIDERTEVLNKKIEELQNTQHLLKISEDKFSKAFKTSRDSINVNRLSDGQYIDINEGFTTCLGYSREDVIGKSSLELNIWQNQADREKLVEGLTKQGMVHNLEAEFIHKDGHVVHGLMSASIHEIDGEKVIISVTKDIQRQKEMENELKSLNQKLSERVDKEVALRQKQETMLFEQRKFADMGQMINAIAHQWRQPLNALGIMIQDIADAYDAGSLNSQYLADYEKSAFSLVSFMSDTIDQFRNFFITSKEKKEFDILGTISEVFGLISAQLGIKGIKYELYCEKEGEERTFFQFKESLRSEACITMLNGYEGEFKQALLNLIYNSVDAIEDKKSKTSDEFTGLIRIEMKATGDSVMISVADNGNGIPEDILGNIFDPFFTTKGEIKGTGIGLYMTKLIFEKHFGGKISVSNVSGGACFKIQLPLG